MTAVPKISEQYCCDRCQRGITVRGTPADVAAAIETVRCRHRDGHAAGDAVLDDDIGRARASARANARARRAARRAGARAAARRRDQARGTR